MLRLLDRLFRQRRLAAESERHRADHQQRTLELAEAVVTNLNRNVMAEHARDVATYHAMKARGETPPPWLAHIVESE